MNFGLDPYTRNARLKPALVAALPAAWTVSVWAPGGALGWSVLWSLFVAGGGTLLLSQLGRDRGKRLEKPLFSRFGGRPSERFLSHRYAPNRQRLQLHHATLGRLLPTVQIPSADDEARDPFAAHEVYAACTNYLISRSRDDRMLFQENMNFGFRRNLWGLKPVGIAIAAGSAVVFGLRIYMSLSAHEMVSPLFAVFEGLNLLMLGAWLFLITPEWVMLAANAYAERLLDVLDKLGSS